MFAKQTSFTSLNTRAPMPVVSRLKARVAVGGLIAAYLLILIVPVVAAWLQGLPPRNWQDELSSGLALCAFAGIQVEFLLSGRFRFISDHVGIDTTMRFHQLMARAITLAIFVHPFLYVTGPANYPTPWDTTRQTSVDFSAAVVFSGLIAWLALIVIVVLGVYREQRGGTYEAWRAGHGLGALIVAVFGTWHSLEAGRYSEHWFLTWFWLSMLGVAITTLGWVYLVKPLLQMQNPYVVQSVRQIADRTWELVISPKRGKLIEFEAGQFVWLNVGHCPFLMHENPFSITSAPSKSGTLEFVVKEVGDATRLFGKIAPGTLAFVDGPHGNMIVTDRSEVGIAFYAGGVGIAPILSILRELNEDGDLRPLLLLYGNRTAQQIVYAEELAAITKKLNFQVEYFLSEPHAAWIGRSGLIDHAALNDVFEDRDAREWLHVICGPLPMIEGVERSLLTRGVPASNIISERFYYD